jgi:hypothetical protein
MDERQPTGSTGARTPTRQLGWVRPVTRRGSTTPPQRLGDVRGNRQLPDLPGQRVQALRDGMIVAFTNQVSGEPGPAQEDGAM